MTPIDPELAWDAGVALTCVDGGSCGLPSNTAATTCQQGECALQTCRAGFADCDLIYANGCEVDLFASADECGQCGYTCPPTANTISAACGKPLGCQVGQCEAGYGDCDGLVWNGCEAALGTDIQHCGACGLRCPTGPSFQATCTEGRCGFMCSQEFYDVDGVVANGCEVEDEPRDNHALRQAFDVGRITACDEGRFTQQVIGQIPSDLRIHPDISLRTNGTVEDWYALRPMVEPGCLRDLNFQLLTTSGGLDRGACIQATVFTDKGRYSVRTSGRGSATLGLNSDAYSPSSTLYLKVEAVADTPECGRAIRENVMYLVNVHL